MKGLLFKAGTAVKVVKHIKNWPVYFYDYALITTKLADKKKRTYHFRNGTKVTVRSFNERIGLNEIFIHKAYNPPGFEIKEHDVVVDVGAQIGMFSVYAAKSAPNVTVYSFEPFPESYGMLNKNLALNRCKNVTTMRNAVGKDKGRRKFYISKVNSGAHSFFKTHEHDKFVSAGAIRLQDFLSAKGITKVDFLKLDIEGAEYEVLFNLPPEVLHKIGRISMEWHEDGVKYTRFDMKKFLEKNGFKVTISGCMLYAKRK